MFDPSIHESYAAAVAALATFEQSERATVTELESRLRAEVGRARHAKEKSIADARASFAAHVKTRDKELAAEVWSQLPAIVSVFADAPRTVAKTIADKWREWNDRAQRHLDAPLDWRFMALALADANGLSEKAAAQDALSFAGEARGANASHDAVIAIVRGDPPAAIEGFIANAERAIAMSFKNIPHGSPERLRVMTSRSTCASIEKALEDAEKSGYAEQRRAAAAEQGEIDVRYAARGIHRIVT